MTDKHKIVVQSEDFDVEFETNLLIGGRTDIGAVVSFVGLCRDGNGRLSALELEHYPGMAEAQLKKISNQALSRWPLTGLTIIHRFGKITPGQKIVTVIATSKHRRAAFEAADFLMDFLKNDAPFWKKEHTIDGNSNDWVEATADDEKSKMRWALNQSQP